MLELCIDYFEHAAPPRVEDLHAVAGKRSGVSGRVILDTPKTSCYVLNAVC